MGLHVTAKSIKKKSKCWSIWFGKGQKIYFHLHYKNGKSSIQIFNWNRPSQIRRYFWIYTDHHSLQGQRRWDDLTVAVLKNARKKIHTFRDNITIMVIISIRNIILKIDMLTYLSQRCIWRQMQKVIVDTASEQPLISQAASGLPLSIQCKWNSSQRRKYDEIMNYPARITKNRTLNKVKMK